MFNSGNLHCNPWVSWSFFLHNSNHQAVKKLKCIENRKKQSNSFHFFNCLMIVVLQKLHETQGSLSNFHELNIYI